VHRTFADFVEAASPAGAPLDLSRLGELVEAALEQSRGELAQLRDRMVVALESTGYAISIFDGASKLVFCNHEFLSLYRLPDELGRPGTDFCDILDARIVANTFSGDDPEAYVLDRLHVNTVGQAFADIHQLNTGHVISTNYRPLRDGGWVTTHKDITEFTRLQDELGYRAYHDALTGLANRHMLQERLAEGVTRDAAAGGYALLLIDLDGFKTVNDTLGHAAGDEILRQVARRLEAVVSGAGLIARVGGDEFAVVLDVASPDEVRRLATLLAETGNATLGVDSQAIDIRFSVGVALAPADGDTPDALLKSADLALYAAKSERQGGYRFFEAAMDEALRERRQLEQDLAQALEEGQFELHYQPILDLQSHRFSGFEALLRWQHPTEGMIAPARFIPVAEETGLIVPIGEWVLRAALAEAANWPAPLRIAVNVSSVQFQRGSIVATVVNALGASGLDPGRVEIEITESVFFENSAANLDALRQLHALGLRIALDDFGTGFSALSYLLSYPFDKIKIDGAFVRALEGGATAQTIVRAVAGIGHGMGITTTAEGIETAAQLRKVHAAGYTEAQGFLIGRPMRAGEVTRLLAEDSRPSDAPALDDEDAIPAAPRASAHR
jgi:diguanylate cyclase (GGDEF)-like protein